jgi:isopenicillin-N epimerase
MPASPRSAINKWLLEEHGIVTHVTEHPEYTGIRVTPNIFTTLEELDRSCDAVTSGIRNGIGG